MDIHEEDKNNGDCDTGSVRRSCRWPCSVNKKGVVSNSIFCVFCEHWVHNRCSGIKGRLRFVPDFKCRQCTGEIR